MATPKKNKAGSVYQLKITLADSEPPIWRRLQVPAETTLDQLHDLIQMTMGWEDEHLHQFISGAQIYGMPEVEDGFDVIDERTATLAQVVPEKNNAFQYEYDFGDGWIHDIVVERIFPPQKGVSYPLCSGGEMACPPEDCGGITGYYDLLEALRDEEHPEHEEVKDWLGEDFNPKAFDLDEVNDRLRSVR